MVEKENKVKEFIAKINKINEQTLTDPYTEFDFLDVYLLNTCIFHPPRNMDFLDFKINEQCKIIYTIIWDIGYSEDGSSPFEKELCVLESFKELMAGGKIEPPTVQEGVEYLERLLIIKYF